MAYSKRDAARISRAVRKSEAGGGDSSKRPGRNVGAEEFVLFVLIDKLVENHRAKARRRYHDIETGAWATDTVDVLIKGWKCTKTWDVDKEGWCKYYGGRWWWLIPEDCGRETTETDETDAATLEAGYDAGDLP
jgi:hypothetical protein